MWELFWKNYPRKVSDIPPDRLKPITSEDYIPRCSNRLPTDRATFDFQIRYAESISFYNQISKTGADKDSLRVNRAEQADAPILKKGSLVCCLPDIESLNFGCRGARTPIWLGEIILDEAAPVGAKANKRTSTMLAGGCCMLIVIRLAID
eukprot:6180526-Pleurochrysis_carterae.AAC.1